MTQTMPEQQRETEQLELVRWLAQLRTDLAESVGGVLLRGARVVQIGTAAGATARPTTAAGALVGFSLRETTGTTDATVILRDGADSAAPLVAVVQLAPGESVRDWFGPGGLGVSEGIYVHVSAGTIEGAVYLRGAD